MSDNIFSLVGLLALKYKIVRRECLSLTHNKFWRNQQVARLSTPGKVRKTTPQRQFWFAHASEQGFWAGVWMLLKQMRSICSYSWWAATKILKPTVRYG
jgi:hypothetical protein